MLLNWPHVTGPRFAPDGTKLAAGLLDFAGIYYPGWKPADLQVYFNRGQFVDAACNLLGQGKWLHPDTVQKAKQEGWDGFIEAYLKFTHEHHWVLDGCAIHVVNQIEKYQGTYDQLGMLDGAPTLLDLKTGRVPNFCGLQLAGYALAFNANRVNLQLKRYGLELHQDGTYKLVPFNDYTEYAKWRILVRAFWISREYSTEANSNGR